MITAGSSTTRLRQEPDMSDQRSGGGPGWKRRFFGVLTEWGTYGSLLYLLIGFPIGLASWISLITMLSVGFGLAVTIVGVPILLLTLFGWCFYADLERLLSNTLLRTEIRPLPFGHERTERWVWPRLKLRLKNQYTWRSLVYLLVIRFPMGLSGLIVFGLTLGFVIQLLMTPLNVALQSDEDIILGWTPDSPLDAALGLSLGVLLMVPALHAIRLTGWLSGQINVFFLQSPAAEGPQSWGEALDRATASAVAWPGVDRIMRTVRASGSSVEVTPKEFDLLVLLTAEPGRPFSREELLEQIWKDDYEVTDRTIDTHMQRLRKKLGQAAECIQTVWGVGYRYQP